MEFNGRHLPGGGLRTFKTALAAALCALIYFFFDRKPRLCLHRRHLRHGQRLRHQQAPRRQPLFRHAGGGLHRHGAVRGLRRALSGRGSRWFLIPLTFVGVVVLILACQLVWVGGVQPGGRGAVHHPVQHPRRDLRLLRPQPDLRHRRGRFDGPVRQRDAARRVHLRVHAPVLPAGGIRDDV